LNAKLGERVLGLLTSGCENYPVYDGIIVIPDVTFHPSPFGSGKHGTVLHQFHFGMGDVGFPIDDAIPDGYLDAIQC
jgi:hypothetical protein